MSAAAAALYAAGIAGVFTLIGAVVGLVVAHRLRSSACPIAPACYRG